MQADNPGAPGRGRGQSGHHPNRERGHPGNPPNPGNGQPGNLPYPGNGQPSNRPYIPIQNPTIILHPPADDPPSPTIMPHPPYRVLYRPDDPAIEPVDDQPHPVPMPHNMAPYQARSQAPSPSPDMDPPTAPSPRLGIWGTLEEPTSAIDYYPHDTQWVEVSVVYGDYGLHVFVTQCLMRGLLDEGDRQTLMERLEAYQEKHKQENEVRAGVWRSYPDRAWTDARVNGLTKVYKLLQVMDTSDVEARWFKKQFVLHDNLGRTFTVAINKDLTCSCFSRVRTCFFSLSR